MEPKNRIRYLLIFLLTGSWFLWSFTLTDPNLYYSSNSFWVTFQQFFWQSSKETIVWWFGVNTFLAFSYYFMSTGRKFSFHPLLLASCLFLLLSNNALSHDIYNYMFNAKAVITYGADPHVRSALQIAPADDWLRFMHNIHTEAPYGRFWTYLSLMPFLAGMGKFLLTFISFKVFMMIGFALLFWVQGKLTDSGGGLWIFFINPLVLIETFVNGHNDVWMMALFFASVYMLSRATKLASWYICASILLFVLSTQIKLATLLLAPIWILLLLRQTQVNLSLSPAIRKQVTLFSAYWADLSAILVFLPLFSDRSQQFHPWYLIWALSFLPFIHLRFIRVGLIVFSITSLLRYVPFLLAGEYSDALQLQMRMITWSAIPLSLIIYCTLRVFAKNKNTKL